MTEQKVIKVLSGFIGECPYKKIFMDNVTEYCDRWGYELVVDTMHEDSKNPYEDEEWFWWWKHTLIERELPTCDWLLWIDMDCIILNMTVPIDAKTGDFDIVVTQEETPETGIMLFRNSEWTRQFMKDWRVSEDYKRFNFGDHPAQRNNHLAFFGMQGVYPFGSHLNLVRNRDWAIKSVHILDRTAETLIMHVPGCPMEEKVHFMTLHLKDVIR